MNKDTTRLTKTIDLLECLRCGWTWEKRLVRLPRVCPRCKNYNWNIPKPIIKKREEEE